MYVLVGVKNVHYPGESDFEERVALFSSEVDAKDYEEKSRLSTYSHWCGRGIHGRQYRAKSLLRDFCGAYVALNEDLPVNPII